MRRIVILPFILALVLISGTAMAIEPKPPAGIEKLADSTTSSLIHQAGAAEAKSDFRLAMALEEQALRREAGNPRLFGRLEGLYWKTVPKARAFEEARNFYAALKAAHPRDPEIQAGYANALGAMMGWIRTQGATLDPSLYADWNHRAMEAYSKALAIDPTSFSALLGRGIYLSHVPGKLVDAVADFKHLLSLQKTRPYYPYGVVYLQWSLALKRNGKTDEAREVLENGLSKFPDDPVLKAMKTAAH